MKGAAESDRFCVHQSCPVKRVGKEPVDRGDAFIGVQSYYYWSSTTDSSYSAGAWNVYLYNGDVYGDGKTNTGYVWPVRAGQ